MALEKNVHKLKPDIWIELPYSPATPFLGTYPEKIRSLILKGTFTPVFIAALFYDSQTWKQPKCPSRE